MRCYFNLVSSHHTITDDEGLEVANLDEARTFAHEAVAEMVQDGVAEIAHWRGWEMEARDAAGTVLFTMGFDAPLPAEARIAEDEAAAKASTKEDGTYAYDKAACPNRDVAGRNTRLRLNSKSPSRDGSARGLAPLGCISRPKPRQGHAGTTELRTRYPRSHV